MKCLACLMNHENCRGEATQYGVLTPIISQVLLLVNSLNTGLWLANLYPGLSLQCSGHKWDASLVLTGHCCQEKLFSFKVLLSWKVKRISLSAEPNHFNWSASMTSFFERKNLLKQINNWLLSQSDPVSHKLSPRVSHVVSPGVNLAQKIVTLIKCFLFYCTLLPNWKLPFFIPKSEQSRVIPVYSLHTYSLHQPWVREKRNPGREEKCRNK